MIKIKNISVPKSKAIKLPKTSIPKGSIVKGKGVKVHPSGFRFKKNK